MDSLGKKAGVSFASGAAPVPSSDSVDSADAEYNSEWNSWALPKVARNLAHQKLEFLNRNFLPFFCLFATLRPRFSPLPSGKTEAPSHLRRAVKRFLPPERTLIRSPLPPRALCSVDPEWESAYLPTNEGVWQTSFRFSGHGSSVFWISLFIARRHASIFPFTARYATNFPICCALRFARSAKRNRRPLPYSVPTFLILSLILLSYENRYFWR